MYADEKQMEFLQRDFSSLTWLSIGWVYPVISDEQ